ncbi:hypothetical protein DFH27DRAFT_656377 [Peziza echinospora]|nr:hypothetical protein DFH27DRAFT_656377 [Peziza echinospora]
MADIVPVHYFTRFPMGKSALHVALLIAGTFTCKALIIIALWHFSQSEDMSVWRKRIFNATVLTLIGVMGVGIGHLLDKLVLLARGKILSSRPHKASSIGFILRGTLSAIARYLLREVRHKINSHTTAAAAVFILVNIAARFGGGFLGFAFNIEDSVVRTEALKASTWPEPGEQFYPRESYRNMTLTRDSLYELATRAVRVETSDVGSRTLTLETDGIDTILTAIKSMTSETSLEVYTDVPQRSVTYKYALQEYRGDKITKTNQVIEVDTKCRAYKVLSVTSTSLTFDDNGRIRGYTSRLFNLTIPGIRRATASIRYDLNDTTIGTCGDTCAVIWLWDDEVRPGQAMYSCNHTIALPTPSPNAAKNTEIQIDPALGKSLANYLGNSEQNMGNSSIFNFRLVAEADGLNILTQAIGLINNYQNGEMWVAGLLGRFTGALVLHMDKVLDRTTIEEERTHVKNTLRVKWKRVAIVLGCLAVGQLLIAAGSLWYCHGSILVSDDVPSMAAMIRPLSFPSMAPTPNRNSNMLHPTLGPLFSWVEKSKGWILETGLDRPAGILDEELAEDESVLPDGGSVALTGEKTSQSLHPTPKN